jgi:monothiol glutaredoxin
MDTLGKIKAQVDKYPLTLYMKGSPQFPQCGFSGQVVHILHLLNAKFAYVNILENPDIRQTLPAFSDWPTFPQLFLNGELIGGCDIITELYENGELAKQLSAGSVVVETAESEEATI